MTDSTSIYVDFNTMMVDELERVRVSELEVRTTFVAGQRVTIGDETLQVEALLENDLQRNVWWAIPDWSTRRDVLLEEHNCELT